MAESNSSKLNSRDTELREKKDKWKNQSEVALLVLIPRCILALLSKKDK